MWPLLERLKPSDGSASNGRFADRVVLADLPPGTGSVLLAGHRSYEQPLEGTRASITMPCASAIESAFDTRVLHIDAVGAWLVEFANNVEAVAPNDAVRIQHIKKYEAAA